VIKKRALSSTERIPTIVFGVLCLLAAMLPATAIAAASNIEASLILGGRTIHVFRAPIGDVSASERRDVAMQHLRTALDKPGEGWTSITPTPTGIIVKLDGESMFTVVDGDAAPNSGERLEAMANRASRALQTAWSEYREHADTSVNVYALLRVLAAIALLIVTLVLLAKLGTITRRILAKRVSGKLDNLLDASLRQQIGRIAVVIAVRTWILLLWLLALLAAFTAASYVLGQFAVTRALSDSLLQSFASIFSGVMHAIAGSLPGLLVAMLIFILARITTKISNAVFQRIAAGRLSFGMLDAHTAPVTRLLVGAAIWIFALAMAYPYLPGSQTDAFKGLTVLLGVMVSIGASGVVGQIASGMILVYTRALLVGDYVRIQDHEGTVVAMGLYVTQLRTGTGEDIALPNTLVLSHATGNFSRNCDGHGYILEVSVTIGYDAAWRDVHAMLLEAAAQQDVLRDNPAPFVLQKALSDFYVEYTLVAQSKADSKVPRPKVMSALHGSIQDVFNRNGVQIMSPHYLGDPAKPKIVPESRWRADRDGNPARAAIDPGGS
jgi:small-conductance mechanosensitive channel